MGRIEYEMLHEMLIYIYISSNYRALATKGMGLIPCELGMWRWENSYTG